MALPKSGKAGSKITNLDDARRIRQQKSENSAADRRANLDTQKTEPQPPNAAHEASAKLTKPVTKAGGNRRFDKEKVERIKSEIARGDYVINSSRIADKYIEHERFS